MSEKWNTEDTINSCYTATVEELAKIAETGKIAKCYSNGTEWLFDFYPTYLPWGAGFEEVITRLLENDVLLINQVSKVIGLDLLKDLKEALAEAGE